MLFRSASVAIKPPNDLYALCADGRGRKICGILCEASGSDTRLDWLIVGFGININNTPPLKRSTSLRAVTGRRISVPSVLRAAMTRLSRARRAGNFV